MCADQWVTILDRVKERTGWPIVDSVEVSGNRWGRTCDAHHADESFRLFVVFTPEGTLRRFDALEPLPTVSPEADEPAPPATADAAELPDALHGTEGEEMLAPEPHEVDAVAPEEAPRTEVALTGPEPTEEPAADPSLVDEETTEPAAPEATESPPTAAAFTVDEAEPISPGSGLDPRLADQLRHESEDFPNLLELPVDEGRQIVRRIVRETDDLAGGPAAVAMLKTSSFALPDHRVPVRVYLPTNGEAPFPVVVYLHGGGWVFGDVDTHDSVCREVANRSECAVVSVGYRRSPENKFPDALEDCYGAVQWLADAGTAARLQTDPGKIAVAGDSAGGNMAAVVCLLARERSGPPISAQVLICPVTAHEPDTPSYRENATGNGLEAAFMPWMWAQYLRTPEDANDPHVAPLRARDLSRLPPALVITAECDLLRDEGEEYGERLRAAGVDAQVTRYPRMPHGFLDYRGLVDEGWDALDEIGEWLQRVFGRSDPGPAQ